MRFKDKEIEIYTDRKHSERGGTEEFRAGAMVWFYLYDDDNEQKDYMMLTRRGDSFEEAESKLVSLLRNMGYTGEIKTGFWTDVYTPREEWYEIQDRRRDLVREIHESLEALDEMMPEESVAKGMINGVFVNQKDEEGNRGLKGLLGNLEQVLYD